jgi:Holliday junction resolvase RusA-like endonuclease
MQATLFEEEETEQLGKIVPGIYKISVPGEPISGSQLKFNRKTGTAYRPKEHKQRVFTVYEYAERAMRMEYHKDIFPVFSNGTPVALSAKFYFPYRKGDYGTGKNANQLKSTAPTYVIGTKDVDNLLKPLKDGLAGIMYANDNQIVRYEYCEKRYSETPRTEIVIRELI